MTTHVLVGNGRGGLRLREVNWGQPLRGRPFSSEVGSARPSEAVEAERRQDQAEPCDTATSDQRGAR